MATDDCGVGVVYFIFDNLLAIKKIGPSTVVVTFL